jgi:predicted short-subunit dehydrogenase-like oxidoreductase (DUF2520 family)
VPQIKNIVLVGAGNVATQFGIALYEAGLNIRQVYSRTSVSAVTLAERLHSDPVDDPAAIEPGADLYVIAVVDDAVEKVAGQLDPGDKFLVHTSGALPMEVLEPFARNYGVIYPVQTFSRTRKIDFTNVPVCIESNNLANLEVLNQLVSHVSNDVRAIPSPQRKVLHMAAVFACNFPNFMYAVAGSLLQGAHLDFDLLKPLILETAEKVQEINPEAAQTGPAFRGDQKVMGAHLEMLRRNRPLYDLYKQISKEIGKMKNQ